jgi:hypothetical protein
VKTQSKAKRRPKPRRALAVRKNRGILRVPGPSREVWELNDEQVTLIKNTVAKGATDDELKLFLTIARRHKLDPFTHQIWFVRRWDKNADSGQRDAQNRTILGAYVGVTQIGIDGLLHLAARDHRDFGSVSRIEYGSIIAGKVKAPEWALAKVWKKGVPEPTIAEAFWEEYAPNDLDKAPFWRKMPRRMLGKCAVALAIRQAYPDLSGVYIPEECARIAEDYTPSGRQIVQPETRSLEAAADEFDAKNPHLAEFEKKQAEELAKIKAKGPLFYQHHRESDTYEITGLKEHLRGAWDLIKDFWDSGAQRFVLTGEQLEDLKIPMEQAHIPFKPKAT